MPFAARTPSALRNQARFAGITDKLYVHPTVHPLDMMQFLSPGCFLSETQVCTNPDRQSVSCRGSSLLLATLAELRSNNDFHAVSISRTRHACWPHQDFTMEDTTFKEGNDTEQRQCNVYGCPPPFALKSSVRRARPIVPVGLWQRLAQSLVQHSHRHLPAHACRMGRLSRVSPETDPRAPPAQYCTVRQGSFQSSFQSSLQCQTWTNHSRAETNRPVHAATPVFRPKQPVTRRCRRCAACEYHSQGSFVDCRVASTVLHTAAAQTAQREPGHRDASCPHDCANSCAGPHAPRRTGRVLQYRHC